MTVHDYKDNMTSCMTVSNDLMHAQSLLFVNSPIDPLIIEIWGKKWVAQVKAVLSVMLGTGQGFHHMTYFPPQITLYCAHCLFQVTNP